MNDESEDNHEENLERPDTIAIIFSHHACEIEPEEQEGDPYYYGLTENLDHTSKFWSYERACPDEKSGIELEKVL